MKYAVLLCSGTEKQFKKKTLKKKLSAMTEEQLASIVIFLAQDAVRKSVKAPV
jgi:hypothetical protein